MEFIQRLTIYKISQGVTDEPMIKRIAQIDGTEKSSKEAFIRYTWDMINNDPNVTKITVKRSAVPAEQAI